MPVAAKRSVNIGRTRPSVGPVSSVIARMRDGFSRERVTHKRMTGFLLKLSREFKVIRDRHEDVASLRDNKGWQRVAEMMRRKVKGNMLRQHALMFSDRTLCDFEKITTDVMLGILGMVEGAGNEFDRAAELAAMKMTELIRVALNEESEVTNA